MAVITKNINNNSYSYLVEREGERVVHRYLGRADGKEARQAVALQRAAGEVPKDLRPLFWDADLSEIRLKRNARYVIERVLAMGGVAAVRWLQMVYSRRKIIEVMLTSRSLDAKSLAFWKLWFDVHEVDDGVNDV
jgi:hypothetical protein